MPQCFRLAKVEKRLDLIGKKLICKACHLEFTLSMENLEKGQKTVARVLKLLGTGGMGIVYLVNHCQIATFKYC